MVDSEWIRAFLTLFVVLDAMGNVPVFYSLLKNMDRNLRKDITRRSVVLASGILIAFSIFGTSILNYFNISMGDFKVTSGVVLFLLSLRYFLSGESQSSYGQGELAVFPLATPLLAGPGSISVTILITERLGGPLPALIVILANSIVSYLILVSQDYIMTKLGEATSATVSRILNLVTAAFAVSLVHEGLRDWMVVAGI